MTERRRIPVVDRIARRLPEPDDNGCIRWPGSHTLNGYGTIGVYDLDGNPVTRVVHRVWYELMVGPVPDGLQLDHLCHTRDCLTLDHLEPVTPEENTLRREHYGTGLCTRGLHPLNGRRYCPTCHQDRKRERL